MTCLPSRSRYPEGPGLHSRGLPITVSTVTESSPARTRVVPVFEGGELAAQLQALVDSGEAKATPKKTAVFHDGDQRVILVGAGKREEADAERFRVAAAAAAAGAKEIGAEALAWQGPDVAGATAGVVQGTLLASYAFDTFKSKKDENGLAEL